MKSKIEKIKNNIIGDGLTRGITAPTNQQLMEKINELVEAHNRYFAPEEVDHLNSQDQVCEGKDLDELMPISYEEIQGTDLYGKSRADVLGELEETLEILKNTQEEWEKEFENPEGQTYDDPTRIPAEYHKLWESHGVDGYEVLETYPESAFELDPEKVVTFIKQLLSERSFSKEELERINKRVNEYDEDRYEDELDRQIVEKVDRLLNLNNKRK